MHRRVSRLLAVLMALGLAACSEWLGPVEPQSPAPQPAPAAKYVPPRVGTSASSEDQVLKPPVHKRVSNRPAHPAPPPAAVTNLQPENSNENSSANTIREPARRCCCPRLTSDWR
jgi:hypothetical protein